MGTITLHPDNEADYQLLIDLVKRLNLTFTTEEDVQNSFQKAFLEGMERSVQEMNDYRKGKIQLRNANDLLNEL